MGLQKQIVPVSLQGGLNQKTDPNQVQTPNLLGLENAQFNKIGQLNKRPGYNILTNQVFNGNNISAAYAIDSFNGELNLFDNLSLYSYSPSSQAWANRGPAISLIDTVNQVIRSPASQQLNPDCASISNIDVFAWEDSRGGCRYSVIDHETGTYIVADQLLINSVNGGAKPKVVIFNGLIYIFYTNQAILYFQTINPTVPNVISLPVPIIYDGYSNFTYDITNVNTKKPVAHPKILYITYFSQGATPQITFCVLRTNNTLASKTVIATGTNAVEAGSNFCLSLAQDYYGNLWFSRSTGARVLVTVTNSSLVPITSNILIDTVVCPTIASIEYTALGTLQLVYEVAGDVPSNQLTKSVVIQQNGTISIVGTLRSVGIASKPYLYNGNNFINLAFQSPLQSTYFGVFLTSVPFTIISKISPSNGGGLRTNNMVAECQQIDSGIFQWANLTKGKFISEDQITFSLLGVQSTINDFSNINKFNSTTFSNTLLFVGGILQSYDGVSVSEQNFHIYPEGVVASQAGGGSLTVGAQYQYQVVYSWTDKNGQISYSTPSPTITVQLTGGNNSVVLTIPTLRLTAKQGTVIQIYRTLANGNASPNPVFYVTTSLLTPPDPTSGLGGGGILNNTAVDTIGFTDVASDADISANQPIYTQGGILPNTSPPSCSMISLFQDRVIIGGLEDPNSLWFSKIKNNNSSFNTVPVEFSPDNVISINQVGGPITALGLMDQNLIIFKNNAVFILAGSGPNNAGGGNSYPDAQLITQQVGCNNPNSVLLFGQGIVFQSPDKGIWLIDRNLSPPTYIGAGVDDIGLQYQVSSATLDPNSNAIIFTTFNGPCMVYNYEVNQWSTYTNHQAVDAISFQNLFTMVKSNGLVYQQNPNIFYDGYIGGVAQPYSMTITTPWVSGSGILGYQRIYHIYLLGTYKGPHTLNTYISYDFDSSFIQTAATNTALTAGSNLWGSASTWGAGSPWGGSWNPYIYQINPNVQQCTSFRLKITDSQTSNFNEGYALSALLLEIGVMPDGVRVPKSNTIGVNKL